jgi:hypothetical protein
LQQTDEVDVGLAAHCLDHRGDARTAQQFLVLNPDGDPEVIGIYAGGKAEPESRARIDFGAAWSCARSLGSDPVGEAARSEFCESRECCCSIHG